jgi:hypothetical protein
MLMVQEAAIHKSLSPVMQHLKLVDYGSMTVLDNHKSSTVLEAQELLENITIDGGSFT